MSQWIESKDGSLCNPEHIARIERTRGGDYKLLDAEGRVIAEATAGD